MIDSEIYIRGTKWIYIQLAEKEMKKLIFKQGDTCHFALNDKKYAINILLSEVQILELGKIPFFGQKEIWRHRFPYYIRSWEHVFQSGREILKIIVKALEDCNSNDELESTLEFCTQLLEFHNPSRYLMESMKTMGDYRNQLLYEKYRQQIEEKLHRRNGVPKDNPRAAYPEPQNFAQLLHREREIRKAGKQKMAQHEIQRSEFEARCGAIIAAVEKEERSFQL